jgi:hypothetical protein
MKPGDLVMVNHPCEGDSMSFRVGDVGLIIEWATDSVGTPRNDLVNVLFPGGTQRFAIHLLEVISEAG